MNDDANPTLTTEVNVFRPSSGRAIAHLPLVGRAFRVDDVAEEVIDRLRRGEPIPADPTMQEVVTSLRRLGVVDAMHHPEPRTVPLESFRPTEATLLFTETCNLSCSYCYASASNQRSSPMPAHVARAAVDEVIANATLAEESLASFRYIGGGEPTVEWPLLVETTDYVRDQARRAGVRTWIRLITNGTLLTHDRVDWLATNIEFVTLSFDVMPELQSLRPYSNGKSTHAKLLEVIHLLTERGVQFHLRVTVSRRGAGRLVDMVRYVREHTRATQLRFEPMAEIGRSLDSGESRPAQSVFVESFKAAHQLGRSLGIDVTCKMFKNSVRRSSRFCDAEFAVAPTGVVAACHRYSREETPGFDLFRIGEFTDGRFRFDMERINALRAIDVHQFSDCSTCVARWNCASGCLSARTGHDGIRQSGPLCDLTRDLLQYSIEQKVGAET